MTDPTVAPPDYTKLFDLTGKRAMVVGGGSGIGREVARGLADHHAHVIVADRNIDGARETAGALRSGETLELDVLDTAQIDAAAGDLLGGMRVTEAGFAEMTKRARALAPRVGFVLEGGYTVENLPALVGAVLNA